MIKGDPVGVIYVSPDQKRTILYLDDGVLMKKSAKFLKKVYDEVVRCKETDLDLKEVCVNFLFKVFVQKQKMELKY